MRSIPEGEDDSGIHGTFLKTNYWVNQEALSAAAEYQIILKWVVKITYWMAL